MAPLTSTLSLVLCLAIACPAFGQSKPVRSKPPGFKADQFEGVFFPDLASQLRGELPGGPTSKTPYGGMNTHPAEVSSNGPDGNTSPEDIPTDTSAGGPEWKSLISPTSLEDLIKGSKLRLEKIVTTPAAFAGGGFQEARKEFSLQSLLFAIIERYPGDVRFKGSAAVARESMSRVAANTKVGSRQVYDEAKKRLTDLDDLLNGSTLAGERKSEIEWNRLIDRVPVMQLLDWAQRETIAPQTASEAQFNSNLEEVQRYAELISVLGQISMVDGMPDAEDSDYQAHAREMITQAQQIVLAVQTKNAELARQSSGKLGQACAACHENFN